MAISLSISISCLIVHQFHIASILFLLNGGHPSQTFTQFSAIHAVTTKKMHHVITMFAVRNAYTDHFLLRMGWPAPPPHPFINAIHACRVKEAPFHHRLMATQIILLANGGGRPCLTTIGLFRPSRSHLGSSFRIRHSPIQSCHVANTILKLELNTFVTL